MVGKCIDMQKTVIFQWILQFLQKHYGPTDRRTDRPTDRRTDKPSYRDAIAASKKSIEEKKKRLPGATSHIHGSNLFALWDTH